MLKIVAGITTVFAASLFAAHGAFADTRVNVDGNGFLSDNRVNVRNLSDQNISQRNNTTFDNNVDVSANTGDVSTGGNAFDSWGKNFRQGNVDVQTGGANALVNIANEAGKNVLNLDGVNNGNKNTSVKVAGNGPFSDNRVDVHNNNRLNVRQTNDTNVDNNVDVNLNTGDVSSRFSRGNTDVQTGSANALVGIRNQAGSNQLDLGNWNNKGGSTKVDVLGNGAFSDNRVRVFNDNNTNINQRNNSDFYNNVDTRLNTGNDQFQHNRYPWYTNNWDRSYDGYGNKYDRGFGSYDYTKHNYDNKDYGYGKYDGVQNYKDFYNKDFYNKGSRYMKYPLYSNKYYNYNKYDQFYKDGRYMPYGYSNYDGQKYDHKKFNKFCNFRPTKYVPVYYKNYGKKFTRYIKPIFKKKNYYPTKFFYGRYPMFYGHGFGGGNTSISTGNANAFVNIDNMAGLNVASL